MAINKISYTSKTTETIFRDLVATIPELTDKWKNYAEDDPGIVLIKLMSYVGDMLSYNMDYQVNECFPQTAIQRKHAQRSYDLIGYKMHWYRSAECEISITLTRPEDNTSVMSVTIPEFTNILSLSGVPYTILGTENTLSLDRNQTSTTIKTYAIQGVAKTMTGIRRSSITVGGRIYLDDYQIDEDENNNKSFPHMRLGVYQVSTDRETSTSKWVKVDNLQQITSEGTFYEFRVDENDKPYIQLNDGWEQYIKEDNYVKITYVISDGAEGRVSENVGFTFNTNIVDSSGVSMLNYLTILNSQSSNGYNPETVEEAAILGPKEARTLGVAITLEDYDILCKKVDGIRACKALDQTYTCDKTISLSDVTIDSESINNGILQFNLLNDVGYAIEPGSVIITLSTDGTTYTLKDDSLHGILQYTVLDTDFPIYKSSIDYSSGKVYLQDELSKNIINSNTTIDSISASLSYAPYTVILKLVANDYGYITDLTKTSLQELLRNKTVISVSAIPQLADLQPIPFNIGIHSYDPANDSVTNILISDSVVSALSEYFLSSDREFGEGIRYANLMSIISNAHEKIEYADLEYPERNVYVDELSYPMLGPVSVNIADNPNYEWLLNNIFKESSITSDTYDKIVKQLFGTTGSTVSSNAETLYHIDTDNSLIYLKNPVVTPDASHVFSLNDMDFVYEGESLENISISLNSDTNVLNVPITSSTYRNVENNIVRLHSYIDVSSISLNVTTSGVTGSVTLNDGIITLNSANVGTYNLDTGLFIFNNTVTVNSVSYDYTLVFGTVDYDDGVIYVNTSISDLIITSVSYYIIESLGTVDFSNVLAPDSASYDNDINHYTASYIKLPSYINVQHQEGGNDVLLSVPVSWWCSRPDLIYTDSTQTTLWGNIERGSVSQNTPVTLYAILHCNQNTDYTSASMSIVEYPIKITLGV